MTDRRARRGQTFLLLALGLTGGGTLLVALFATVTVAWVVILAAISTLVAYAVTEPAPGGDERPVRHYHDDSSGAGG